MTVYRGTFSAKKSLSQNFLTSPAIAEQVAEAAELGPSDVVVEIGSGQGILTIELVKRAGEVIAIEKDRRLAPLLTEKFADTIKTRKLKVIEGDILDFDTSSLAGYKVVGNIPYNITGEILRSFLSRANQPTSMTLMVQKEVAERIMARDGKESVLSLSVKAYGSPRIVRKVSAGSFSPKPKVDSAIIHISGISRQFFSAKGGSASGGKDLSEERFFKLVKAGFAHKRKQLWGNLSEGESKFRLELCWNSLSLLPTARAEELTLEKWRALALCLT